MKEITMQYPSGSGNELWDGLEHTIIPNDLLEFELNGNVYYVMQYRDITHNKDDLITILSFDENNNLVKNPLSDYSKIDELLYNVNLTPVDMDILPEKIELGNSIDINSLITPEKEEVNVENVNEESNVETNIENTIEDNKPIDLSTSEMIERIRDVYGDNIRIAEYGSDNDFIVIDDKNRSIDRVRVENNGSVHHLLVYLNYESCVNSLDSNALLYDGTNDLSTEAKPLNKPVASRNDTPPNDGYPTIEPPTNQIKYPAYVEDDNHCFIYRNIFDRYLRDLYDNLPRTTRIDNRDCILIRNTDNDIIYERSNHGLVADYINKRVLTENEKIPNDDISTIDNEENKNDIIMDYPLREDYKFLEPDSLWDGLSHKIKPKELYEFTLENVNFYYMRYDDLKYNTDCDTLLFKTQTGDIMKAPLDDYNKLSELLNNISLNKVSLDNLPEHISLGSLEVDYLISLTNLNNTNTNSELDDIKEQIANLVYPRKTKEEITDEFVNNFDPTGVSTQFDDTDIDKFNELKEKYNKLSNNNIQYKDDFTNVDNKIENIEMDYPTNETYSYINNELWDGKTHDISPKNLQRFDLNGRVYYYMEYHDNSCDKDCITLLTRTEKGEIRKVPLDNYDKLSELLNKVELKKVSLNILPKHISVELLEMDYLLKLNKKNSHKKTNTSNNIPKKTTPSITEDNNNKKSNDDNSIKKKKRMKVVEEKNNIKDWFKKHPRIRIIALGLALALTIYLGMSSLMVINSALWGALGGKGAICGVLHGINSGLSHIVGFGTFNFAESGLYLNGAGQALYEVTAPRIIEALGTLAISAPICKTIINKIRNRKKTNNRDELIEKLSKLTPEQYASLPEDLRNEIAHLNNNNEKEQERNVGRKR